MKMERMSMPICMMLFCMQPNQHRRDLLMGYAKGEFERLADLYRPKTKHLQENYRLQYNNLVAQGSTVSKHLFHLPETINVDLDNDGNTCTDHLFVKCRRYSHIQVERMGATDFG